MNETIDLMLAHSSVRRFTDEPIERADLEAIITAGRAASSWKNFQSYSIIVIQSEEKKQALYDLVPQPAILQAKAILFFVGDHNRASKAAELHGTDFDAKGTENLLISSVDASLAGQNALLGSGKSRLRRCLYRHDSSSGFGNGRAVQFTRLYLSDFLYCTRSSSSSSSCQTAFGDRGNCL